LVIIIGCAVGRCLPFFHLYERDAFARCAGVLYPTNVIGVGSNPALHTNFSQLVPGGIVGISNGRTIT